MKISLPITDIENTLKSVFSFYFNPLNCLSLNEQGDLLIEEISGFKVWFYLTIFQILLIGLIAFTKEDFSLYFFIVVLTYSIIRMLLLGLIAFVVGIIVGIKDYKLSVGYMFILTGIVSTITLILSIPAINHFGYENTFIHKTIPENLLKDLPGYFGILEPLKIIVLFISMFIYGVIVPKKIFKISWWKILVWLIGIQLTYHFIFREKVTMYLSKMVELKLFE